MMMGGLGKLMEQVSKAQNEMSQIKEELEKLEVEAESDDGTVRVIVNGHKKISSIKLQREKINLNDIERLEQLVVDTVNQALTNVDTEAKRLMKSAAGGILENLPPGFNIPGME